MIGRADSHHAKLLLDLFYATAFSASSSAQSPLRAVRIASGLTGPDGLTPAIEVFER
jgi:hypothetical protein